MARLQKKGYGCEAWALCLDPVRANWSQQQHRSSPQRNSDSSERHTSVSVVSSSQYPSLKESVLRPETETHFSIYILLNFLSLFT